MAFSEDSTYRYKFYVDYRTFDQNVVAGNWIKMFKENKKILTDTPGKANLKAYALMGDKDVALLTKIDNAMLTNSYIFLGYNVMRGDILVYSIPILKGKPITYIKYATWRIFLKTVKNTIYSNDDAMILV
ncbi:hypothetical protein JCM16138_02220 [Thermococcus atlanticus]